jgi:hypothetical protein
LALGFFVYPDCWKKIMSVEGEKTIGKDQAAFKLMPADTLQVEPVVVISDILGLRGAELQFTVAEEIPQNMNFLTLTPTENPQLHPITEEEWNQLIEKEPVVGLLFHNPVRISIGDNIYIAQKAVMDIFDRASDASGRNY